MLQKAAKLWRSLKRASVARSAMGLLLVVILTLLPLLSAASSTMQNEQLITADRLAEFAWRTFVNPSSADTPPKLNLAPVVAHRCHTRAATSAPSRLQLRRLAKAGRSTLTRPSVWRRTLPFASISMGLVRRQGLHSSPIPATTSLSTQCTTSSLSMPQAATTAFAPCSQVFALTVGRQAILPS